jgi:predicted anti-sigma-YlaC factor YlaD
MANGYVPPNAAEIIESPRARKIVYKVVGYIGLALTVITAAFMPLGLPVENLPWLLSAWAVFGVLQKWSSYVADRNVIVLPNPVEDPNGRGA